jgi:DNA-nicking Smr family endonuclease
MGDDSGDKPDDEFRRAMADVRPIGHRARVALPRAKPPPVARQRRRDERAALREAIAGPVSIDNALDSGEELSYLRDGVSRQVLRRLRRGHWVIEADLDLHGMNRAQTAEQLVTFLRACGARRMRCVRVVHGKGLGSRNREPVLKHLLHKLLPRRDDVVAFCQAPTAHGGGGALLVLLKQQR